MGQSKAIASVLAVLLGAAVAAGAYLMMRTPTPPPMKIVPAPMPAPASRPQAAAPEAPKTGTVPAQELRDIAGRKKAPDGSDGPAIQKVYGDYDPPADLLQPPAPEEPPPATNSVIAIPTPDPNFPNLPVPTNAAGEPDPAADMSSFDPATASPKAGS